MYEVRSVKAHATVPRCPVCGFNSIYTDGHSPCSVECAIYLARIVHEDHKLTLDVATRVVREEAEARGLPAAPCSRDIRETTYRYVQVTESKLSAYWLVDRELLTHGLNVEYVWLPRRRGRIYRFAPSMFRELPVAMHDYRVRLVSAQELDWLGEWHFLKAAEPQ